MGAYDKGEGRGLLVEYTADHMKSVFPIPDVRIGVRCTALLSLYDGANYANFPFTLCEE